LPEKAPPPWAPLATVGVDDDLAACETGVAVRATDDELACWVDVVFAPVVVEEAARTFVAGSCALTRGMRILMHILADLGEHAARRPLLLCL
jgi:hypothetical protein